MSRLQARSGRFAMLNDVGDVVRETPQESARAVTVLTAPGLQRDPAADRHRRRVDSGARDPAA
jgi:hypothetical protein